MYATAKEMFFPVFAEGVKEAAKPVAQAKAVKKDELSGLIDRMVSSLGLDYDARRRYFELTRTA
jgi:hypothetical protein